MTYTLGFIGAGNMAEAIATAAIRAEVLKPDQMIAADPREQRQAVFASLGITATDDNADVLRESDQVLLAVKPQKMADAAQAVADHGRDGQVFISIMAGIRTAKLAEAIGRDTRIVRVMPNTPMMVGLGMAGIALGAAAQPGDDELAMKLFSAAGKAIRVEEARLDAITAVSGSGPAYVFYLAQAMEQAAEQLGLADHARLLVSQTILGAAYLLAESDDTAAQLRRKVTSPGGTTEAAISAMDAQDVQEAVVEAIRAAEARSRELGA